MAENFSTNHLVRFWLNVGGGGIVYWLVANFAVPELLETLASEITSLLPRTKFCKLDFRFELRFTLSRTWYT